MIYPRATFIVVLVTSLVRAAPIASQEVVFVRLDKRCAMASARHSIPIRTIAEHAIDPVSMTTRVMKAIARADAIHRPNTVMARVSTSNPTTIIVGIVRSNVVMANLVTMATATATLRS